MKNLLVGLCNNPVYNQNKINLWLKSFKQHCDYDVTLIIANPSDNDRSFCDQLGVNIEYVSVDNSHQIYHKRLFQIYQYLTSINYDLILSTDVFDVAFQSDPFKKLDIINYDVFLSGEGVLVNQENWNYRNIDTLFPNEIIKCQHNEVINSGIIAGKRLQVIEVYRQMYELCEQSTNHDDIQDQAALIVLVCNKLIPGLKIFNLDDAWAMHCAVAGPTQFFESWGFSRNLKYGIPKIINGKVYTATGILYDIVHQFNRIPEWHNQIEKVVYDNL